LQHEDSLKVTWVIGEYLDKFGERCKRFDSRWRHLPAYQPVWT